MAERFHWTFECPIAELVCDEPSRISGMTEVLWIKSAAEHPFAPRSYLHFQEITSVRLAGRMGAEM